jgi:hypothetical protein
MAQAASAKLGKSIDVEDLIIDRDKYIGTVVKLKYKRIRIYTSSSSFYLYVYDTSDPYTGSGSSTRLSMPNDRDAREWAIDEAKDNDYYDSSSGSLYVYVETDSLLAVGRRVRKSSGSNKYSW